MLKRCLIAAVLTAVSVGFGPAQAQDGEFDADTVLATVNGTEITLGHIIVLRSRLPQQYQSIPPEQLYDGILQQMIQQTAIGQGVEMSLEDRLVIQNEERAILANRKIEEVATAAVTDEAIQAAYDATYANAEAETEYNASHILLDTLEEAEATIERANAGEEFAMLASELSTGPSGPNGGSLGWFGKGVMVPAFEEAVVALEPGTISEPVETQFGFHVILVNETRIKEAPALDEVRAQLRQQVESEAVEAMIAAAQDGQDIVIPDLDGFDPNLITDLSLIEE